MKTVRLASFTSVALGALLFAVGCKGAPGSPEPPAKRPSQLLQFGELYQQNCAACHGASGKNGAAISLANPVYLAIAGADNLQRITANGVPGTLMPAFAKSQGGMLTDQQISVLAQGMMTAWGSANALGGQNPPAYASTTAGEAAQGQKAFGTFCARCHGTDGSGSLHGHDHVGSLVDPAYLALISDQGLRSLILAGQPKQGMPDWRSDATGPDARPMTEQEVNDVVAWLVSHRTATPGQPYGHS
jgi:mono/diheme cytochrome c family protein